MSEEVVERLKAEGQLIRNTGTNSIRSISIQMDKFEEIFQTISEQITMQTQFLSNLVEISTDQFKINEETNERENIRQQREGLASAQEEGSSGYKEPSSSTDKSKKDVSLSSLMPNFGSGFLNDLLKGALFAGGIYALGNVFKGFIEAKIGESEFTEGLISAISWTAIGAIFGKKFGLILGAGNLLSNALGLPSIVEKIGDAFNLELEENDLLTQGIGTSLAAAFLMRGGLKTKLLGGIIILTNLLGDKAKDWLINQGGVDPDWANTTVDVASLTVQGAAIGGSLFGLPGAIAGAMAGLAIGIGGKLIDWLRGKREEAFQRFEEDVSSIQPLLEKALRGEALTEDERAEVARVTGEATRNTQLALPAEQREAAEAAAAAGQEALGALPLLPEEGYNQLQIKNRIDGALAGNQEDLLELANFIKGRGTTDREEIKDALIGFGTSVFATDPATFIQKFNAWEDLVDDALDNNSFSRGTKGFQDFGPASFAILHGREAIVPEETPAGRFLNEFFNSDWSPKMSKASIAEEVSTISTGGINMPVIVNNSPTVAPIINNVQGGPNINSTSIFGSGGGDRSRNPYGITNGAN